MRTLAPGTALAKLAALAAFAALAALWLGAGCSDEPGPLPGDEFPAVVAFRAYTAEQLDISIDEVEGGPIGEAQAALSPQRVGSIWAFGMWGPRDGTAATVRGWATANGVVITLEQNLGPLLAEAGLWGGGSVTPKPTPRQLAELLTWSLGTSYRVGDASTPGVPSPGLALVLGAGFLHFAVGYQEPGPGGAGGGPTQWTLVKIELTAARQATVTREPITTAR